MRCPSFQKPKATEHWLDSELARAAFHQLPTEFEVEFSWQLMKITKSIPTLLSSGFG